MATLNSLMNAKKEPNNKRKALAIGADQSHFSNVVELDIDQIAESSWMVFVGPVDEKNSLQIQMIEAPLDLMNVRGIVFNVIDAKTHERVIAIDSESEDIEESETENEDDLLFDLQPFMNRKVSPRTMTLDAQVTVFSGRDALKILSEILVESSSFDDVAFELREDHSLPNDVIALDAFVN